MTINLPATLLTTMRAQADALMTDTCTIEVGADSVGDMGELLADQYTVVATGVACRVIMLGRRYGEVAGRVGERETVTQAYRLICPYATALAVNQRITLSDGSRFQVVDLSTERTSEVDAQASIVRTSG